MKKVINSKGFGGVEGLLILLIIGVLGFASWNFKSKRPSKLVLDRIQSRSRLLNKFLTMWGKISSRKSFPN